MPIPIGSEWLLSALAFATSMSATPGPNNTMVAASGANFGFRRTLPHLLGVSIGFPVMLLVIALGAAEPLRTWPWLHQVLRWAGAAYLLWLAWKIAVTRPDKQAASEGNARPMTFLQAALFQWINPKAWIIAAGAVVTYTGGNVALQASLLAMLFVAVCIPSLAFWTTVGVGAGRLLRSPRALRWFNLTMAALLVASLVPVLVE
jgi:threonine/homoserine/homoserine lactone efflux protein